MRWRSTAVVILGVLASINIVTTNAQEDRPAGPERTSEEYNRELERDVEDLKREVERLAEKTDDVKENVDGRLHDLGVSIHMLHIVVIVFSLILTGVVAVLGYRQARSVKEVKKEYEKNEELIRRIELDARQKVNEMKTFAERARNDMERAEGEVARAQEIYEKAEELMMGLEERSVRAERHVKDIEEMKRVVEAAAAELPPVPVVRFEAEEPEAIREALKKYPTLRVYTEELYEKAMEGDITDEDTLNDIYQTLFYMDENEKALDVANILTEKYPANPDYHVKKGRILGLLQRYYEALSAADEALALKPEYIPGHGMRVGVFIIIGLTNEAVTAAEKALALNPDDAEAYLMVGSTYNEMGRPEDALEAVGKAIALQPGLQTAHLIRSSILCKLGRAEEALAVSEGFIALNPDQSSGYSAKGLALYVLGRREEALAYADKAIKISPRNAQASFTKTACLKTVGKYEEALAEIDKAITFFPNFPDVYITRATVYGHWGKKAEMLADLVKAFEISPSEAQTMRKFMIEGWAFCKPLGRGSDFDAFQDDPDFRRLVYPEDFKEGEKSE